MFGRKGKLIRNLTAQLVKRDAEIKALDRECNRLRGKLAGAVDERGQLASQLHRAIDQLELRLQPLSLVGDAVKEPTPAPAQIERANLRLAWQQRSCSADRHDHAPHDEWGCTARTCGCKTPHHTLVGQPNGNR